KPGSGVLDLDCHQAIHERLFGRGGRLEFWSRSEGGRYQYHETNNHAGDSGSPGGYSPQWAPRKGESAEADLERLANRERAAGQGPISLPAEARDVARSEPIALDSGTILGNEDVESRDRITNGAVQLEAGGRVREPVAEADLRAT